MEKLKNIAYELLNDKEYSNFVNAIYTTENIVLYNMCRDIHTRCQNNLFKMIDNGECDHKILKDYKNAHYLYVNFAKECNCEITIDDKA